MRAAAWISVALTAVLVSGVLAAYAKYRAVWDSIGRITLTDLGHRPPKYTHAVNILVFGYDQRAALTRRQQFYWHVGHVQENSNDTVMLVHLSPGRQRVTVISFPRDTLVPVYQCNSGQLPDGTKFSGQNSAPGAVEQISTIYSIGGPSCLVKTIEQQTGIYIDHFIGLGLAGFVHAINDIGGVIICSPVTINDSVSGLRLKPGYQRIFGVTALKLWRTRENLGMGTDTQRIQRDQFFMAQLLQSIERSGLLTSPTKMLHVVSDLTNQMLIDNGLTPTDLLHIAESLRRVNNGHVQFITAPWEFDPTNQNRVIFLQPQATTVFTAIAHDRHLPKVSAAKSKHGTKGTTIPTVSPAQVSVAVLNGSGVAGIAGKAAGSLTNLGFKAAVSPVNRGNAPNYNYTRSVIEYSTRSELAAVNTLKAQLSNVTIQKVAGLKPGTLDLIIGHSYTGLKSASSGKKGPSIGSLAGTYGGITGAAGMCSAAAKNAFTGPGTVNG